MSRFCSLCVVCNKMTNSNSYTLTVYPPTTRVLTLVTLEEQSAGEEQMEVRWLYRHRDSCVLLFFLLRSFCVTIQSVCWAFLWFLSTQPLSVSIAHGLIITISNRGIPDRHRSRLGRIKPLTRFTPQENLARYSLESSDHRHFVALFRRANRPDYRVVCNTPSSVFIVSLCGPVRSLVQRSSP